MRCVCVCTKATCTLYTWLYQLNRDFSFPSSSSSAGCRSTTISIFSSHFFAVAFEEETARDREIESEQKSKTKECIESFGGSERSFGSDIAYFYICVQNDKFMYISSVFLFCWTSISVLCYVIHQEMWNTSHSHFLIEFATRCDLCRMEFHVLITNCIFYFLANFCSKIEWYGYFFFLYFYLFLHLTSSFAATTLVRKKKIGEKNGRERNYHSWALHFLSRSFAFIFIFIINNNTVK